MLKDVLEHVAALLEAQVMEQGLHDGGMARVADRAVVEIAHAASQRVAQGADAAGSVEGLVGHAVEREFLALLQRRHSAQLAIGDHFTGLAVLVDDPIGAPREVVVERIGGKLRQCADAQAYFLKLLEVTCQIVADDRDEPRSQAALGNKRGRRCLSQFFDAAGGSHILGQIEVVHAGDRGRLGDLAGCVVWGRTQHRKLAAQGTDHRLLILDVQL